MCERMERRWSVNPALKVEDIHFNTHFRSSQVDNISYRIIPPNYASQSYVPVATTGDGNCLFNSASLAVCQNENLAHELRLRTCFELARNREFYRNHPLLVNSQITYVGKKGSGGIMSLETLCDLYCFSASSSDVHLKQGFEAAFNSEIMRTSVNYSYSGTLQIMALSSVLGVPVETIYPDQNYKLMPIYQNLFNPRCWSNPGDSTVVRILWTSTLGWPDRSKEFVVNHFVPLFTRSDEARSMQNTATETTTSRTTAEETENPWYIFTR